MFNCCRGFGRVLSGMVLLANMSELDKDPGGEEYWSQRVWADANRDIGSLYSPNERATSLCYTSA